MRLSILAAVIGVASLANVARAVDLPGDMPSSAPTAADAREVEAAIDTHPVVPTDATWAGSMIIAIGLMFVSAIVVGPIVRAEMTAEEPMAATHHHHTGHHGEHHH